MTRSERWAAIIFFGVALFGAEAAVRAISPPATACVRSGIVGLLKADIAHPRHTPEMARPTPSLGKFEK